MTNGLLFSIALFIATIAFAIWLCCKASPYFMPRWWASMGVLFGAVLCAFVLGNSLALVAGVFALPLLRSKNDAPRPTEPSQPHTIPAYGKIMFDGNRRAFWE